MTEATLNANDNVDICLILSKFRMWLYDRMSIMYTCSDAFPLAVHNRTFWRILVSSYEKKEEYK